MKILKKIGIGLALILVLALYSRFAKSNEAPKAENPVTEVQLVKGIQGMSPVDIYLDLEKKGYTIDKQYIPKEGTLYNCTKKELALTYNVTIFKNNSDLVEEVKIAASLTGQDNKKILAVKPFLKYISTVSYEGSDAAKITQWIEDNFNKDGASTVIGKAKFTLSGNKFSKVIQVEPA